MNTLPETNFSKSTIQQLSLAFETYRAMAQLCEGRCNVPAITGGAFERTSLIDQTVLGLFENEFERCHLMMDTIAEEMSRRTSDDVSERNWIFGVTTTRAIDCGDDVATALASKVCS